MNNDRIDELYKEATDRFRSLVNKHANALMGPLMKELNGRVDGKIAKQILIKELMKVAFEDE